MRKVSAGKGKRKKNLGNGRGCLFFVALIALLFAAFNMSSCTDLRNLVAKWQYPIEYDAYVEKYAEEFSVDKNLIYAVIRTESRFDQYAISSANAKGLMQLRDETAEDCSKKLKMDLNIPDDLYNPEINIKLGCYYFSVLHKQFEGNTDYTIMAYNCGPGNVKKWIKEGYLKEDGNYTIPFPETENYLRRVKSAYKIYQNIY